MVDYSESEWTVINRFIICQVFTKQLINKKREYHNNCENLISK